MSLYLCLLAYGASFDIVLDPFLHPNPPVVLLNFLQCFISSWMSGCGSIMCFAYDHSFYFSHIWNDDLSSLGMEYADLLS